MPLSDDHIMNMHAALAPLNEYIMLLAGISETMLDDGVEETERAEIHSMLSIGISLWGRHRRYIGIQHSEDAAWLPF